MVMVVGWFRGVVGEGVCCLSEIPLPGSPGFDEAVKTTLEYLLAQSCTARNKEGIQTSNGSKVTVHGDIRVTMMGRMDKRVKWERQFVV